VNVTKNGKLMVKTVNVPARSFVIVMFDQTANGPTLVENVTVRATSSEELPLGEADLISSTVSPTKLVI